MANQSAMPSLLDVLKSERNAFFAENAALPSDEIQRRWETRTTVIMSVLHGRAPTSHVDLDLVPKQRPQQHANHAPSKPIPIPGSSTRTSVWLPTPITLLLG